MTVQRVGGVDVVTGAFERTELLTILTALGRYSVDRRRRGAERSPMLDAAIDHLTRLAREFDRDTAADSDMPARRPQPRSRHADAPMAADEESSAPSSNGSMRPLTCSEFAEHVGLHRRTIQRHVEQGLLDAMVIDGKGTYAIPPEAAAAWEAQRTTRKAP